jgi:fermentation-respiration switch protein FrsA (DUF1100 family)
MAHGPGLALESAWHNMNERQKPESLAGAAGPSILIGLGALLVADIARRIYRRTQVFCPERSPAKSWDPADYGVPRECATEEWFETPDGEWLYGWYCRAEHPIASAVFCHGNSGNLTTVAGIIPNLLNAGCNVLFFDYRGFGRSTGRPSFSGVVSDGVTASRFHDRLRPPHLPAILYGFSLGGAVAAQVMKYHRFDGLVLQSTFTSLVDIARVTFRRFPLHLLAGNFFDTREALRDLRVPLLLFHGTADEVVPCWMGHALYDATPGAKRIVTVDGGLHKDLYIRDADSLVWTLSQFIADLGTNAAPPEPHEAGAIDGYIARTLRFLRRHLRRYVAADFIRARADRGAHPVGLEPAAPHILPAG